MIAIERSLQWIENPWYFTKAVRQRPHPPGVFRAMPSTTRGLVRLTAMVGIFALGVIAGGA